jgi:hypothetical protein
MELILDQSSGFVSFTAAKEHNSQFQGERMSVRDIIEGKGVFGEDGQFTNDDEEFRCLRWMWRRESDVRALVYALFGWRPHRSSHLKRSKSHRAPPQRAFRMSVISIISPGGLQKSCTSVSANTNFMKWWPKLSNI